MSRIDAEPADRSAKRGFWHSWLGEVPSDSDMNDQIATANEADRRSLDLVQRVVVSLLVLVVMGTVSAALSAYLIVSHGALAAGDVTGLWVMTGLVGLLCVGTMLMINRRRPFHPLVVLGLAPMALSGFWIFG